MPQSIAVAYRDKITQMRQAHRLITQKYGVVSGRTIQIAYWSEDITDWERCQLLMSLCNKR